MQQLLCSLFCIISVAAFGLAESAYSVVGHAPQAQERALAQQAEAEEWILPTLTAIGATLPSSFQSSITLANYSAAPGTVSLEFSDSQGNPVPLIDLMCQALQTTGLAEVFELGAHETQRLTLTASDFNGWARAVATGTGPIVPQVEVTFLESSAGECPPPVESVDSSSVLTTVEAALVRPGQEFSATGFINPSRESAFSIVNPSSSERAHIIVTAKREDGSPFDSTEISLEPGRRLSLLLFELLIHGKDFVLPPERPSDFFGEVSFSSDIPIAVGGLQVLLPEGKWSNLPVTAR